MIHEVKEETPVPAPEGRCAEGEAAVMSCPAGWRCVIVAPPSPIAAVGGALRHAFALDAANRSSDRFESLLMRLR